MPRRKQSHPQPVKCEGVKGQGSKAARWGGAGVGSVAWVQVWVEGGFLRDGVGGLDSLLPIEVLREPERVYECGQ